MHAHTEEADEDAIDNFNLKSSGDYNNRKNYIKIILGNCTADLPHFFKSTLKAPVDIASYIRLINGNKLRFIDLVTERNMKISSTQFFSHDIHKGTKKSSVQVTKIQIDLFLIDAGHGSSILNVRNFK